MFEKRRKKKNKGIWIFGSCIILMIAGFLYSYYSQVNGNSTLDNPFEGNITKNNINQNNEIEAGQQVTVITPNTMMVFTTLYSHAKCGHKQVEEELAWQELINMTEEELEDYLRDWSISKFELGRVELFREIKDGLCPEHYMLKDNEGKIAIYKMSDNGSWKLLDTTHVEVSSLRASEREELKKGIIVGSEEDIARYLEHFGS